MIYTFIIHLFQGSLKKAGVAGVDEPWYETCLKQGRDHFIGQQLTLQFIG